MIKKFTKGLSFLSENLKSRKSLKTKDYKFNLEINKNSPYSKDLSKRGIDNISFEDKKQEILNEFAESKIENIVKNIGSFLDIGNEQDLIRENFRFVLGEDFFEENYNLLTEIFDKNENKNILDGLKNIDKIEDKNYLIKILVKNLGGDEKFFNLIKNFLENTEEFQEELEKYEKILLNISLNEDLKYNVYGGMFSGENKWKNGKGVNGKEKLKNYKLPVFASILLPVAIMDINGGSLLSSPKSEISPNFFINPIDSAMNIWNNLSAGNIGGGEVVFYGGSSLVELGLAMLLVKQIGKLTSGGKKMCFKSIGNILLTSSLLLGSVTWTAGLQALGQGVSVEKEKLHTMYFNNIMRAKNLDNNLSQKDEIKNKKIDIGDIFDSTKELISIIPDMYSVYGGNPVYYFDSKKIINNLIGDINSGNLNKSGPVGGINKYIEQVRNIGNLDKIYKSIFQNILNEIKGYSPSSSGLGPEAYWKIKVLLISSGNLKGKNFDEQISNFVNKIYKNKKDAENIVKFMMENKIGNYNKIEGNIPFETLSESQEKFISSNEKILEDYIKNIQNYIKSAEKSGVKDLKIGDFNLIIKNFNLFVEKKLKENFENYIEDINGKKDGIIGLYKERDIDKSIEIGNGKEYKIANANSKIYDNSLRLKEIKEKYIDIKMIIDQYEKDIKICKINLGSTYSIENSISTGINSFAFNISYIIAFLLATLASVKIGYRELEDGTKLNHFDYKEFRDEEFDKIEGRIKNIFENLKDIAKNKGIEIDKNFESFKEIKTRAFDQKKHDEIVREFKVIKDRMNGLLNKQ